MNRGHEESYLKATNTGAGNPHTDGFQFGSSVAISGDTLVVGAPQPPSGVGAIYVFVRDAASWAQQAYLTVEDGAQQLGTSVAISGNTIVAAAPLANPSTGVQAGAYVFERSGTTWSAGEHLSTGTPLQIFGAGANVAIDRDTIVVGDSAANSAKGGAFVFVRSGATWSQQTLLVADGGTSTWLGVSVGISGDTVVAGDDQQGSNSSGAAYVFTRTGTTWSQQALLKASSPDTSDYFGASVAIDGDSIVVGAYGEDSAATVIDGSETDNSLSGAGATYVFVRNGSSWSQQAYLKPSKATTNFGWAVAISADSVVVGTPFDSGGATGLNGNPSAPSIGSSGAAYLFARESGHWSQHDYIKATNPGSADGFGWSVAISTDTVVVGAYQEDGSSHGVDGPDDDVATDSGAAYLLW